ncbi:glutamate--tRNA ligase 1 [Holospora undulata HU1]|uniref:Glutamate--tRNA ligase 1 n=2 Tax=Holospora TaxID=44747 RepID=A0A061JIL1_9PROT|nr:glutamate--tRNA ligase 1 [Holospora undulata HU1]
MISAMMEFEVFMKFSPIVRFAPSPTGFLHLGNARIALFNWVFARKHGGTFILRIDDTDKERSKPFYTESLKKDLQWLGIDWDVSFSQSDREEFYTPYIESLKHNGYLYPCCETAQELEAQRASLRLNHHAPVFDKEKRRIDNTRPKHWRFSLRKEKIFWNDALQGECHYDTSHISDPIVIREDRSLSYLLTSVLDDQDPQYPITHVIRGMDHYVNTAIQCQIFEALKKECPTFIHLPLLQQHTGEKFSKREKGSGIQDWRAAGIFPESICQVLLNLSCENSELTKTFEERVSNFSWDSYSKASQVRFDLETIWSASNHYFSALSWESLQPYLLDFPCKNLTKAHWQCIAPNIYSFLDIQAWDKVFGPHWHAKQGNTENSWENLLQNPLYLEAALFQWNQVFNPIASAQQEICWKELWKNWTKLLAQQFSVKSFEVCNSLRWILTGKAKGPPMIQIFPLIGGLCIEHRLKSFSREILEKTERKF